jgi:hypothetical protein
MLLDKVSILIEKTRVQILTDKQTVFVAEKNLRILRDEIMKSQTKLDDVHEAAMKVATDNMV